MTDTLNAGSALASTHLINQTSLIAVGDKFTLGERYSVIAWIVTLVNNHMSQIAPQYVCSELVRKDSAN